MLTNGIQVVAVVTKADKPVGRKGTPQPPAVKKLALAHNLPIYQPEKASDPEFVTFLKTLDADLYVVAAFSEILKENLLEAPRLGCINVHASILPKYRGAAPIQRCIMAGEKESGVTIMAMDKGLDTGGILSIAKTPITEEMTAGELAIKLTEIGSKALIDVIKNFETITPQPQPEGETCYAKKLKPEDGKIDWNQPCETIHNLIRGVSPKPGAWCEVLVRGVKKKLSIKKASQEPTLSGKPGEILSTGSKSLLVACQTGALSLDIVQLEGKKALAINEFLRGFHNCISFRNP